MKILHYLRLEYRVLSRKHNFDVLLYALDILSVLLSYSHPSRKHYKGEINLELNIF